MIARRLALFALLVGGCSDDAASDDSGSSGPATTSSETTDTPPEQTTAPGTTSPGEDSGSATSGSTGGETGIDPDTGSGSTGEEPVGSPGCRAPMSLSEGEHTFMLDGYDRRYILRLPQNYSSDQPWPLVFALHGNGGNPGYWDQIGGDRDIRTAFQDDAIIIIPEAIGNAWRDYEADPETWPAGIELELEYFDTVLDTALQQLCIDEDHIFSMGFSGGGSFSGVLGCRREYIRAIAVGGSVIYFDPEAGCESTPAAWIDISEGDLSPGREAYRDFFRDLAGCQESSMPGEPEGCVNYGGCGADTPVTYCTHPGGHQWPAFGVDATKAFFEMFYGDG